MGNREGVFGRAIVGLVEQFLGKFAVDAIQAMREAN